VDCSLGDGVTNFGSGWRLELPKVADKVAGLDTALDHSAVRFLVVDAVAATAFCGTRNSSVANLGFRVFGHGGLTRLRPFQLREGAAFDGL
jgi:hypothetical protein